MGQNVASTMELKISSQLECEQFYANMSSTFSEGELLCNATWDHILCWPPAPADTGVLLPCPPLKGVDTSEYAHRFCNSLGRWEGKIGQNHTGGWSNYTKCFIPEIRELMDKLYSNSEEDGKRKLEVANTGRILETIGLSISLASILISLMIFSTFRILQNNRTRIHWHLFVAMKIQLLIRLTLYIDQYVTRQTKGKEKDSAGIDNTPMLCEAFYILLEYARTAMFLWMFIEGLYLHNRVTVSVFQEKPKYRVYYLIGYGFPLIITTIWAVVMVHKYTHTECWWGYNLSPYFWILEGPRLTVIFLNLLFLLNILRVLITKLQATVSSEFRQIKKAVRAAIVLLPLLGITNIVGMVHSPVDSHFIGFAAWTYGTIFLKAFQGFFIALIYCFLNNEVRATLKKVWRNYHSQRCFEEERRHSMASMVYKKNPGKKYCSLDVNNVSVAQEIELAVV